MKLINLGMEAIAFQSPEFADKMTKLIDQVMQERSGKMADNSKAGKDLNKLLRDSTGLNISVVFDTEYPPCCLPFHINPDTILGSASVKEFYLEDSERTMERLKKIKETSFIDLKNAKVGGIFSEPAVPIFMGYFTLLGMKLTSREIAAIVAHEVGHCFVAMELAFRTVRTNQILSSVAKASGGGDKGAYKYVLKTTEEVMGLKTGVLDEIVDTNDAQTATMVTLGHIERQAQKESAAGNATYDMTTFEALSDNYASRLGLGKELVTALQKLTKAHGGSEYNLSTRIMITLFDVASLGNLILAAKILVGGAKFLNPVMSWFYVSLTVLSIYSRLAGRDHNNVYDTLTIRFKRIKEQLITYTKDNKLPAKDVKRTLESITHIEKMMGEISEYKGFLTPLFNMIDPSSRAVLQARDIQSKLESIAANELYMKAAQIRTLEG